MAASWQSDSTVIDRVRIRAVSTEAPVVRQRVERALRGATLRPSRLPSSAILFVRKLRDTTPASRISDCNRTQVLEWERSLNAQLDRLAADAIHAAVSPVPASAESVLFAERGEMLACLAFDWLQGTLRNNWWWSSLLTPAGGADSLLAQEWTRSPEFVPLALEHLANRSQAVALMATVSDELATTLLRRVMDVFGLPQSRHTQEQEANTQQPTPVQDGHNLVAETSRAAMPWSPFVPEADGPGLTPLKRMFLAEALMLRRAPNRARTVTFQTAVADWFTAAANQEAGDSSDRVLNLNPNSVTNPAVLHASPEALGNCRRAERPHETGSHPAWEENSCSNPRPGKLTESLTDPRGERWCVDATDSVAERGPIPQIQLAGDLQNFVADQGGIRSHGEQLDGRSDTGFDSKTLATTTSDLPPRSTSIPTQHRVQSAFAGVFFFVNVALGLGLYSDFTAPRGENLELDLWDFLWLLALRFVGEDFFNDNLNPVLAALAGRTTAEHPGANFQPPHTWEIPSLWLREFPEPFAYKEVVREGRTQVIHPAGFLLKDQPHLPTADAAGSLQRWTDWIAAYIRARLVRAIDRQDGAEFLCRISGEVEITAMHVDVYYSLQTYPTEIRLAGLDRDPGWVPAAGRYVAYHFD